MKNYIPVLSKSILQEPKISNNYGYPMLWDFQEAAMICDKVLSKILAKL